VILLLGEVAERGRRARQSDRSWVRSGNATTFVKELVAPSSPTDEELYRFDTRSDRVARYLFEPVTRPAPELALGSDAFARSALLASGRLA
jgi:hypothetical protein